MRETRVEESTGERVTRLSNAQNNSFVDAVCAIAASGYVALVTSLLLTPLSLAVILRNCWTKLQKDKF